MPVNTPRKEHALHVDRWSRCRDCADGSDAVKAAGPRYLPPLKSHKKDPAGYNEYLLRALFFNAMGRTVEGLAGAIFQKPPEWELDEEMKEYAEDITMTGISGEMFGLKTTREILTTGRWGILVDMANPSEEPKGPARPAIKPSDVLRPYVVGYKAEDIIGWGTQRIAGDQQLTLVVLREFEEQVNPTDAFELLSIEQFRVLMLDEAGTYLQQLWIKPQGSDKFVMTKELRPSRRGEALTFIPFVFMSAVSIEPAVEKPPLLDLADVNLSHYRTMADLEHGRHYTALPTPWIAGTISGDDQGELAIGSGVAWILDKDSSVGMLEFSGAGLSSLVTADQDKRKMMATLGARLLEDIGAPETATAVSLRHGGDHATIRTIAAVLEQGLTKVLRWMAWWIGTEKTPEECEAEVELNKEFFSTKASPEEIKTALLMLQSEQISYETFYSILSGGGWSRDGITSEEEQETIEAEREEWAEKHPQPEMDPNAQDPNAPPQPNGAQPPPAPVAPPPPPPKEEEPKKKGAKKIKVKRDAKGSATEYTVEE